MREEDFRVVLSEWKVRRLPLLIEREVKIPSDIDLIVTIVGPRQSGKTFRLFLLVKELSHRVPKENIVYIDFEHERLRGLDAVHLEDMLKVYYELYSPSDKFPIYLFLDEVQNVKDWYKWVRRVQADGRYRIYLTGSSSKLSSREIATSLRGRSVSYTVFPFSFREFLKARKFNVGNLEPLTYIEERGRILALLEEYVKFGGYPKVVLTEDFELKAKILKTYYETIFYKDLIEHYRVNPTLLDHFLRFCVANHSKLISVSKIYEYLKSLGLQCSKSTLIKYLEFSKEVFFLLPVEIFSYSIRERKLYPKKLYIVDNGLIKSLHQEEFLGKLIENTVAIELLREERGIDVHYWKEYGKRDGSEVDFVVLKNSKPSRLIQVTYTSQRAEINPREIAALEKASKELGCKEMSIITWDYEGVLESEQGVIKCTPLWKWLLKPDLP